MITFIVLVVFFLGVLTGLVLSWLISLVPAKLPPVQISFYIGGKKVENMDLKVSQQLPVAIQDEDKFGNAAGALDAPPSWSITDPTLASLTVAADGMSATCVPTGKLGACQLQVSGQAAGKAVAGSLDLNMLPGDVTQIVLQPGAAVDQP